MDNDGELKFEYPAMPANVQDTGFDLAFLEDLILKIISTEANCTSERVADKVKLPLSITETVLQSLYKERFIEIRERTGAQMHRYGMLDRGWNRAQHLFSISGYVGPAPVTLDAYTSWILWMRDKTPRVDLVSFALAYSELVLSKSELETLGLVLDSRRSLFLTGPPGSGKTTAARAMHAALRGEIWIPYAIEIDGQVIRVFDPHVHHITTLPQGRYDKRWLRIKPPLVTVGGELTLESMDLIFASNLNFYEAPFQMKANGGLLIIDDFGRQRIEPRELLNRWIVPLENHVDYLTLHTGKKIEVPFEQILIFATNLDTGELVDDAFLRRLGYRLAFTTPSVETFAAILDRYLESRKLHYDPELLGMLLERYKRENRTMKSCEPRDLVERCLDICRYESLPQQITLDIMHRAWNNYFGIPS